MSALADLTSACRARLKPSQVITEPAELRTYECDGLSSYRSTPGLVVLAESTTDIAYVVAQCAALGVPFVARGSGTGLSGGALPRTDGVLIVASRLNSILDLAIADERAVVEPGVINANLTAAAAPHGYYYAPDPSSQQVCSIGGNVAENSGGAHCLKYGFTAHHVTGLEVVMPDGSTQRFGGLAPDPVGYDVVGAVVGSEGTLGVVTEATVRLLRAPQSVQTVLAAFTTIEAAGDAVSAIISAGVLPAAIELMDALAIEAAEAAVHPNYPAGAGAVLVVELDGPTCEVDAQLADVTRLCGASGAFELRVAADAAERGLIWKGRKSAFAAVGRISPDYIVQDGVIPRTALADVLQAIDDVAHRAGLRVANVFHAGDGNLHPLVLFDEANGETERAEEVSNRIIELCLEHGGSITGEHGVGHDKVVHMGKMFSAVDLDVMQLVRCAFDPAGISNPGKVFPTPRLCGERPGKRSGVHPLQEAGVADVF
ncbi:MAG TPA: FAD-linked oxidase C-terminal domain-containing protein [Mycobacteriales bacterium]|jgi:glycolate oxidase|nr:FAD-linked oxidase C-terminal domain-containing protein [Mycobacteriales bacterium]